MYKAVFFDRDGVINDNANYVNTSADIKFIRGVFQFAAKAYDNGYKLFVVTNQGGVAAGHQTLPNHAKIMQTVMQAFYFHGCALTAYYSCMHLPPNHEAIKNGDSTKIRTDYVKYCECRKPKPGMILQAQREHHIDLAQSILIGDMHSDIDAANAAGIGKAFMFNVKEGIWPEI